MGHYEHPDYEVILAEAPYELREYKTFYIVEYSNADDPEIKNGFGTLFKYISNDNQAVKKISMTVPVIEEIREDQMRMAFVVPKAQYEQIPEPNSRFLSIKKIEKSNFAVIRYGGLSNKNKEQVMIANLTGWMENHGYTKVSNFMLAFYNAPFTPPMLRHNEIMVSVETRGSHNNEI